MLSVLVTQLKLDTKKVGVPFADFLNIYFKKKNKFTSKLLFY